MTTIGLHDADGGKFPNLALMKLSSWHKSRGDSVGWWASVAPVDRVYSSRVFSWTERDPYLPADVIEGGTGADISATLDGEIEHSRPDFGLYGIDYGIGFLTRGCPRRCPWCVVPEKEGGIRAHAEFGEFVNPISNRLVLLDNNPLAHDHGLQQIESMNLAGMRIDFNQGLDARIVARDEALAKLLAESKWIVFIRFACDTAAQMKHVEAAVGLLRKHSRRKLWRPNLMAYVLIRPGEIDDAVERIEFLRLLDVAPFAQPYRDPDGTTPDAESRRLARYVNHRAIFHTTKWEEYRRGTGHASEPGQRRLFG